MRRWHHRSWTWLLLTLLSVSVMSRSAWAHAILMESTPKLNSTVKGPDVPVILRFNVRVDGSRSRLQLLAPDGSFQTLPIAKQASPAVLQAQAAGLKPGAYQLQWHVLASDGHMSSGKVAFTVS